MTARPNRSFRRENSSSPGGWPAAVGCPAKSSATRSRHATASWSSIAHCGTGRRAVVECRGRPPRVRAVDVRHRRRVSASDHGGTGVAEHDDDATTLRSAVTSARRRRRRLWITDRIDVVAPEIMKRRPAGCCLCPRSATIARLTSVTSASERAQVTSAARRRRGVAGCQERTHDDLLARRGIALRHLLPDAACARRFCHTSRSSDDSSRLIAEDLGTAGDVLERVLAGDDMTTWPRAPGGAASARTCCDLGRTVRRCMPRRAAPFGQRPRSAEEPGQEGARCRDALGRGAHRVPSARETLLGQHGSMDERARRGRVAHAGAS